MSQNTISTIAQTIQREGQPLVLPAFSSWSTVALIHPEHFTVEVVRDREGETDFVSIELKGDAQDGQAH